MDKILGVSANAAILEVSRSFEASVIGPKLLTSNGGVKGFSPLIINNNNYYPPFPSQDQIIRPLGSFPAIC